MHSSTLLLLFAALSSTVLSQGTNFITQPCTSDADCASNCCGFNSGKCAGPVIAQERDGGCGFGDAQPNDRAAQAFRGGAGVVGAGGAAGGAGAGSMEVNGGGQAQATATGTAAAAAGTQVISGECSSDADCASGCCAANTGKCAARFVAEESGGGCGFGGSGAGASGNQGAQQDLDIPMGGAGGVQQDELQGEGNNAAGNAGTGSGKAPGTQFITGPCGADSDCASQCCGFNSGKCAAPIVAQERDGGCGFGDAQPNDDAVRKLRGRSYREF